MSGSRLAVSRSGRVLAITASALVLTVPTAVATVTPMAGASSLELASDSDSDNIVVTCAAGQVKNNGGANLIACSALKTLNIVGDAGNDFVDLSALQAADFPQLSQVSIASGDDTDNVKGSFFGDIIDAGYPDTVQGLGGNDIITSGGDVFGGDGDDILDGTQGLASGGAGDDRILDPGSGPYDGGTGTDSLELDFAQVLPAISTNVAVTDAILHLDVVSPPVAGDLPSTGIERYVFVLPSGGTNTWNSSAYSGDSDVTGGQNVDKIVGGPGADVLTGRSGNDEITGGAGVDIIRGGAGDDGVSSRDGVVDRVDCGDGTDTVVADTGDVLSGCENVELPPAPPPPPPPPPPPAVVPVTGSVTGPKTVEQGVKATFRFTSSTAGATFQCKLDKGAWKACTSPRKVATKNLKASKDGTKHVLKVRAVVGSAVDSTPSKKTFLVLRP